MAKPLPQGAKDLLDTNTYVVFSTIRQDGSPHSVVMWANRDGDDVLLTTRRGTVKERNLRRDARASVCFYDPANPGTQYSIYGSVTVTEDGADGIAVRSSRKYVPERPDPMGYLRRKYNDYESPSVIIKLTPDKIHEGH
jgi:PPOX class probable F420-dependent enzyme